MFPFDDVIMVIGWPLNGHGNHLKDNLSLQSSQRDCFSVSMKGDSSITENRDTIGFRFLVISTLQISICRKTSNIRRTLVGN